MDDMLKISGISAFFIVYSEWNSEEVGIWYSLNPKKLINRNSFLVFF